MALFSRRTPKSDDDTTAAAEPAAPAASDPAAPATDAEGVGSSEPAASVGISVSSFQGLGSAGTAETAPAPAATRAQRRSDVTIPGLRDNVLLRESLAKLPEKPQAAQLLDLARQVLQGHLFLRVKGDARALLAEGKALPLAIATIGDRRYAIAYSSGAALATSIRADGDADTSAMGQPTMNVLRHVLAGETAGLIIDPASGPARAILPRELLERMVAEIDEDLTIKTLLAQERTEETVGAVVDALTRVPVWVAVNRAEDGAPLGVAEGRSADGSRFLEVYSHPLEVVAMGRNDQPAPLTPAQLAAALTGNGELTGILLDPRGPWIRLTREDLAPVLALAG